MPKCSLTFEIYLQALETADPKPRWNGGWMASDEASEALFAAVDEAKEVLRRHGFSVHHSSYGVLSRELDKGEDSE